MSDKLLKDIVVSLTTDRRSEKTKDLMATLLSNHFDTIVLPFLPNKTLYIYIKKINY